MKNFIFLGMFPPPYGGVTQKNRLLFDSLAEHIAISQSKYFDKRKCKLTRIISLTRELVFNRENGLIIGLSQDSLKKITYLLYCFNQRIMNKSIVMVMGGTFHNMAKNDVNLQNHLKKYKKIYVETVKMKESLNKLDINNVGVFPNCRKQPNKNTIEKNYKEKIDNIKCLYFSKISLKKGADTLLVASELLKREKIGCKIDFYGHIEKEYKEEFLRRIRLDDNAKYLGVFKSKNSDDIYNLMSNYDVLIFPTKWKTEGVPGVLVESKFSGIPAIVSNNSFNSEVIENGISGIVLDECNPQTLSNAIKKLYNDYALLKQMSYEAILSSRKYILGNYIKEIISAIKDE